MAKKSPSEVQSWSLVNLNDLKRRPLQRVSNKRPQKESDEGPEEMDYDNENEELENEIDSSQKSDGMYPDLNKYQDNLKNRFGKSHEINAERGTKAQQSVKPERLYPDPGADMEGQSVSTFFKKVCFMMIIILVLFISVSFCTFMKGSPQTSSVNLPLLMMNLESQFEGQPQTTFKTLKSALKSVLNVTSPTAPAIILTLADAGVEDTAQRFALNVAKVISPEKYIMIGESMLIHSDAKEIKRVIDEKLKSGISDNVYNAVVTVMMEHLVLNV